MNIIIGGRGSGRTTKLIELCAQNKGSVIMASSLGSAKYIADIAKRMGLDIPAPISFSEFCNGKARGLECTGYYFDNLDLSLCAIAGPGRAIYDATVESEPTDILWFDYHYN